MANDDFQDSGPSDNQRSVDVGPLSEGAQAFIRQFVPEDDDRGCLVSFETVSEFKPFKSKEASEREGQTVEIYEPVVFIRINIRGNDKLEVFRPIYEADKRRFPFAWQEYKRGEKERARGIALMKLGFDSSIIRGLAAKNVFTVEDMAEVDDNNLQNLGTGAREFRVRAREYLATHKVSNASNAENEQLKALVAQQSAQLAQLMESLAKQNEAAAPARRGRPPKSAGEPDPKE